MTHDEVVHFCHRWEQAASRHDVASLAPLYSDDATVESPMSGTVTGRDAVLDAYNTLFASFPDMAWAFEPPVVDGDHVVMVGEAKGTSTGRIMGLPSTGRAFRVGVVFLFELRDGHIVRDRRIYDYTGVLVQLGVMKAKPV